MKLKRNHLWLSDKPSEVEGFPMRGWSIRIYLLDETGKETPATIFEKATYKLHPSFKNPTQSWFSGPAYCTDELKANWWWVLSVLHSDQEGTL